MGKVTVKHYINKTVKPRIEGSKELYPLYVQVIANRTNFRFKSNFPFNDGYLRETDLLQEFVINSNEIERKELEKIVSSLLDSNSIDLLTADYIKKCSENLWDVLNRNFGILFEEEGKKLKYDYPAPLCGRTFYDINEVLIFTESDIEQKFSENYYYCKVGMNAMLMGVFLSDYKELELYKITVFDLLHGNGSKNILEVIEATSGYYDDKEKCLQVLDELKKLALL
jgi:hypothetical protein